MCQVLEKMFEWISEIMFLLQPNIVMKNCLLNFPVIVCQFFICLNISQGLKIYLGVTVLSFDNFWFDISFLRMIYHSTWPTRIHRIDTPSCALISKEKGKVPFRSPFFNRWWKFFAPLSTIYMHIFFTNEFSLIFANPRSLRDERSREGSLTFLSCRLDDEMLKRTDWGSLNVGQVRS